MTYFITLERSVEDRIPNGMWVMKDMQKNYMLVDISTWKPSISFIITTCTISTTMAMRLTYEFHISVKKDLLFFLL